MDGLNVGTLWALLKLDDQMTPALKSAGDSADGFSTKVVAMGAFIGTLAAQAIAGLIGSLINLGQQGFTYAKDAIFSMNSTLETATLRFTTLMGDADLATEHVRMLFEIAKKTPFETGPIIEASLMLQTFGGAALNTRDNIIMLGDAAAATGAPIEEVSFWVGRLYSMLEAGKPFGEAALRLQELAVMSPQARAEMEALQKAGADADTIFKVFTDDMERFGGAMEAQAGTWSGVTSTFKDTINILLADTFKPFFEFVRDGLQMLNNALGSEGVQATMEAAATTIRNAFGDDTQGALQAFALGLISAGQVAIDVIDNIAHLFRFLFDIVTLNTEGIVLAMASMFDRQISMLTALASIAAKLDPTGAWDTILAGLLTLRARIDDATGGSDAFSQSLDAMRALLDSAAQELSTMTVATTTNTAATGPAKVAQHEYAAAITKTKDATVELLKVKGDLAFQMAAVAGNASLVVVPAIENMNASFTEAGASITSVIPSTNGLTSALMGLPLEPTNQNVSQAVVYFADWNARTIEIANSLLYLGSVIPGVMGSILSFAGTAVNAFLSLTNAISTIKTSWSTLSTAFSGGFSLGGISTMLGGISSIIGVVGTAIQMFSALGSAIKRAFTSEETELVNPNRDLFTSQFIGAETDPFQAIANSTIQAAMSVYGVDWDTAWAQYAEPLIRNLQDADTYAEFKNAQLAIGELFRQAGVTLDIYNEAGIATQYRSGVFDSGYAIQPITSTTDLGALQQQYTTQAQTNVQGAYAGGTYGGTYFQSGSMAPMGGSGLCIHIENLYVGGSTGQAQAASFFDALFAYVSGGGEALSRWRDLNCAAGAA